MATLRVHSTESFGSVDGPGIRFIIFLKGCAMRCQYCHNPDTWAKEGAELIDSADLLQQALRYKAYWGEQGGITVSGGEALLQMEALTELFTQARTLGINTCLDTCGQPFRESPAYIEKMDRLMAVTDLVLLDIKHIDSEAHKRLTGHPNENILAFARYLSDRQVPVWIRHVLVPGITDSEEQLTRLAAFIRSLSNVQKVEVLPY
ncbi:MAG: pyruvate formate lyase-activating protein, partial [Bacteroidaceae bacterium]|nr:pyruvate formate lyase-activating protein [Bacteroidaceae bacterium]